MSDSFAVWTAVYTTLALPEAIPKGCAGESKLDLAPVGLKLTEGNANGKSLLKRWDRPAQPLFAAGTSHPARARGRNCSSKPPSVATLSLKANHMGNARLLVRMSSAPAEAKWASMAPDAPKENGGARCSIADGQR